MNPLAKELNTTLENTIAGSLLSSLGKRLYFPKSVITQSAEAKEHATRFNATAGMASSLNEPIYLSAIRQLIPELPPRDIFEYSSTSGEPLLRELWRRELIQKNPELDGKAFTLPIVTSGITHGISIAADLFTDTSDVVMMPDMSWENYRLIFEGRSQAKVVTFPFFTAEGKFNSEGLRKAFETQMKKVKKKVILILNFPNNPTGYSPSQTEAAEIIRLLQEQAEKDFKILVILDDSYFGLFYEDETYRHSLFGPLCSLHDNILAIKTDGATKENYAWGFRIGFLTYGSKSLTEGHYMALLNKTSGAIRTSISSCCRLSQTLLIKELQHPTYQRDKEKGYELLKRRYIKVKQLMGNVAFPKNISILPFNSGYFNCFKLENGGAENLRLKLLHEDGIGTIAIDDKYLRVAFSQVELNDLEALYQAISKAASFV
jgi:aspartate/methionine/tyrosine aminotransferase